MPYLIYKHIIVFMKDSFIFRTKTESSLSEPSSRKTGSSNTGLYSSRVELSIQCSSCTYLILFRTQVELELITELDIFFKLGSFNFISNTS
jgi:hypothetical protein